MAGRPPSAAAEIVEQGPRLARRRDAELRAQALDELAAGGQRRGAVAGRGQPLDQSAVGRFRQRVKRDLGARQPDRLRWIDRGGRSRLEGTGEPVCVLLAGLDRPLFLEALEDRRAARLERPRCIALVERPLKLARVDSEVGTLERDRVPRCDHVPGRGPERLAQLGQRDPQARARRLVEHVRPKARRKAAPWLWSRGSARDRRAPRAPAATRAARSARRPRATQGRRLVGSPASSQLCSIERRSAQAARAPFTRAERCPNGRPRPSAPCQFHAAATFASSPGRPGSPRSATSWRSSR